MKKKISPVLIVVCLILVVALAGAVSLLIGRYTPTSERENLDTYFGMNEEGKAALVINDVMSETSGLYKDEEVYLEYKTVEELLDTNFYWDEQNQQMLLTQQDGVHAIVPGDTAYSADNGAPALISDGAGGHYLAASFIKKYTDMDCSVYSDYPRAVIRTKWDGLEKVNVTADTQIRVRGGIKSKVLTEVKEGTKLTFLEAMENWTKVASDDGYIGYVENEKISAREAAPVHPVEVEAVFKSISRENKINLAWHQVTSLEGNQAFPGIVSEASGLTVISPTWFKLADNEGTVTSLASQEYVDQAHAMGLEVWGLVDNFSKEVSTTQVLSDTSKRARIIEQLVNGAVEYGMDGINVDFEQLAKEGIPHFLQFLRELTLKAHEKNLVISVDNPVPQNYNMYYKRGAQGKIVDYVIMMGYDEHYSGGEEAGSVASLSFVEQGIKKTLEEVPANKVINAIPFYTRLWIETFGQEIPESETYGMNGADKYVGEHQMTKEWDASVGQNVAVVEDDKARYTIWLEDEQSIEEKMKLIQNYDLAGVAEWKLGLERSTVWPIISKYLGQS